MASARRDDLAKRLAARLDKAPAKGRAMNAGSGPTAPPADSPKPATPGRSTAKQAGAERRTSEQGTKRGAKQGATKRAAPADRLRESPAVQAARLRRGAAGTVLRGHLVPDAVHRDARRRKAALRAPRGRRVTWDDVMSEGLALLIDRGDRVDATLDSIRRSDAATVRRRLVQATLPAELDSGLVDIQLDLGEQSGAAVTYEQLWTSAILLWLDATE